MNLRIPMEIGFSDEWEWWSFKHESHFYFPTFCSTLGTMKLLGHALIMTCYGVDLTVHMAEVTEALSAILLTCCGEFDVTHFHLDINN